MLPYSVVLTVLAASVANCHPGGYTGLGGLYKNMNQNADYMQAAKHAAKMAVNIFDEVESETVERARKSTVYVPTFFTNQPQPAVHQAQLQQLNRPSRDSQVGTQNKIENMLELTTAKINLTLNSFFSLEIVVLN